MTPLVACVPMCLTFVGLAIILAVVVIFDVSNRIPGDDQPAAPGEDELPGQTGPPPVWVMALMVVAIAVVMLALAWYWPE
jgi:hypothetical protein